MDAVNFVKVLNRLVNEEAKCRAQGKPFDHDIFRIYCRKMNFKYPMMFDFETEVSDDELMLGIKSYLNTVPGVLYG